MRRRLAIVTSIAIAALAFAGSAAAGFSDGGDFCRMAEVTHGAGMHAGDDAGNQQR
jgi:hypothetical protein